MEIQGFSNLTKPSFICNDLNISKIAFFFLGKNEVMLNFLAATHLKHLGQGQHKDVKVNGTNQKQPAEHFATFQVNWKQVN